MRQGRRAHGVLSQAGLPVAQRRSAGDEGIERVLAVVLVFALHAGFGWFGARLLVPSSRESEVDDDPVLVWLPARVETPLVSERPREPLRPLPRERRQAARSEAAPAIVAPQPEVASAAPRAATESPAEGLSAIVVDRSLPDPAAPPLTPWDAPVGKAFASRKPVLPGQGAQRFKMQPPSSIASTVRRIGRMFGGGGPNDCEETRKNIRDLAVLGAEAVAQEVEEERRNCGN
ncbi:hypothetical protein [Lysobacter sp. CA199]|uniref:hypothetical protein n=1 Tax=Lysobacter sp. CA199 TaxID=3455608 RepID=UPI003F8D75BC